jgi:hypothetical protein
MKMGQRIRLQLGCRCDSEPEIGNRDAPRTKLDGLPGLWSAAHKLRGGLDRPESPVDHSASELPPGSPPLSALAFNSK